MIGAIIELLKTLEFQNSTENIQFAKGAYRVPRTFKENLKQYKRWLLRK